MKIFIESNHPQTILKYNPCTQYSKEAFIEHYLFASHPFHLNDLMDGKSYSIDMRNVSDELYAYSGGYPFSISGDIRSVPS